MQLSEGIAEGLGLGGASLAGHWPLLAALRAHRLASGLDGGTKKGRRRNLLEVGRKEGKGLISLGDCMKCNV